MNKKSVVILAGAAVVLGGAAYFLNSGTKRAAPRLAGKPVVPAFRAADVAKIEIGDRLTLVAGDDGWTVASLYGYPADREKIAENVLKLRELRVGQVVRGKKLAATTPVVLRDAAGRELAKVVLGETHQGKPAGQQGMMFGGYPDGRYLAFEGETVLVKDALEAFDGDAKKWCSTRVPSVAAAEVTAVAYAHGGQTVALERGTNTTWTLKGLTDKEELDESKLYSVDSALSYVDFTSVADPKLTAAEMGLTTGWVYTVTTKDGTNHVATVGNAAKGGDRYLKLSDAKWVFTIPSYAAEAMMKTRKDFVKEKAKPEPKPEAKKPEPKKADAK